VDLQKINLSYKNTIETQSSAVKDLSERLAKKQEELDDLKKSIVANIRNVNKDLDYLKKKLPENQRYGSALVSRY
jgi:predicted  nucleic acid-binding Zn-ribbon protein